MQWSVDEVGNEMHVSPIDDLMPHKLCRSCWCMPIEDDVHEHILHHQSMDRREDFESGIRLPS